MLSIDTNKWPVLQNLIKHSVAKIEFVYIFGKNGKQVIIITKDHDVYAFGDNSNGCLGLGHRNAVQQPTLIKELCQKRVINIEFGSNYSFILALNENGTVFYWGTLTHQEIANAVTETLIINKPTICDSLTDKKIIDIKAGLHHSLALTRSGDVFLWGFPERKKPSKVSLGTNQKIISICSGCEHCLAITECGDVYWARKVGDSPDYFFFWTQLRVMEITQISCGPNHSLLLSNVGNIYCFGDNKYGQCGDGTIEEKCWPEKVDISAKFIDIAATKYYNISVGLTNTGLCYIWGECGKHSLNVPIGIPGNNNIYELIEYYSSIRVTYKPIHLKSGDSLIFNRISDKFDKREYSDIAFKLESKSIYAQKSHLINVCKHFEVMFSGNNWIESDQKEIEIKDYSYSVYYSFIKYLYTDSIEVNDKESIELLDLANCYLEEKLKQRCIEIIKKLVKVENVFAFYNASVKTNANDLKDYCIEFIQNNFADKTKIESILENAISLIEK